MGRPGLYHGPPTPAPRPPRTGGLYCVEEYLEYHEWGEWKKGFFIADYADGADYADWEGKRGAIVWGAQG